MIKKQFRGLAIALLFCATGAASAIPQTPGSNVLMTQCDPHPYNNATSSEFRVTPYKSGHRAILAMRYQNEADSPATAVVFGLVSAGKLVGLGEDDGRFARDALIDHDVFLSQEIFPLGPQTHCVVLRVKYANGMAWFNPEPPVF
jgi:hypothetical protein